MLTVGSLFSGIGGLEYGLEKTNNFETIWQSEIDEYASKILKKHWPSVPNLGDIRQINWGGSSAPMSSVEVFPAKTSQLQAEVQAKCISTTHGGNQTAH